MTTLQSKQRNLWVVGCVLVLLALFQFPSEVNAQTLSAGQSHTCRIGVDGLITCWGVSDYGQVSPPSGAFSVTSGGLGRHNCGIRNDGTLTCWGSNGRFGEATTIPPAGTFSALSAGIFHNCAVRTDGTLACWGGENSYGEASPPAGLFKSVSAGSGFTCAVRTDLTAVCWGRNEFGQATLPTGTFDAVDARNLHHCAVRTDGTLTCQGYNFYGQANPPAGTFSSVSTGGYHSCAVRTDGTLACWGADGWGQASPPTGTFSSVSAGNGFTCAIRSEGTLACWGYDGEGQAPQLELLPLTLSIAVAGATYGENFQLVDVGYAASSDYPYIPPTSGFALVAGTLPPGMTLTAAGLLSGTPTNVGTFSISVEGEDANGFVARRNYILSIEEPSDNTAPVIMPTVSGTFGSNGWYTSNITIAWSISDAESAITSTTGCNTATLSTDVLGAGYTCTASSAGGTSSESVTVKRDATAPVLSPVVTPSVILLNGSGSIEANANDSLSGIATQSCTALDTTTVGSHTITCSATDLAGNTATATATYSVIYGFVGFSPPVDNAPTVNVAKAGQTIPFKWRLVDAAGTPITNLNGVTVHATSMGCADGALSNEVDQYVSAGTSFINHGNGNYQYNWQSPNSFDGTCKQVLIDLGDGSTRIALFRFK